MPEGDTIHRTALALDRALAGQLLVRFEAPRLMFRPFPDGTVVEGVDAVGKHCLVRFDDGRVLHTHKQMTGSWHLYRPGERWRKGRAAMRAMVAVPDWEAVCFAAPHVELTEEPALDHLGPDLCRPEADLDAGARRLAELEPGRTVGEGLLDQRVVSGIGNIWKNEACFACGVDPFTPAVALTHDERRQLLAAAAVRLRRSVAGERPTVAVYGRQGKPCPRCGAPIRWAAQGAHRRGTFWCPACQPARSGT